MTTDNHASSAASHWGLDPEITFLNHGSFGACPRPVLERQREWRARMERQPVQFFIRDYGRLLDEARAALAAFLGADPADLAFVPNATTGVNAVLRSLDLQAGDELLTTDHGYNACRNALAFVAQKAHARVVVARVPFPLASAHDVVTAVLTAVTPRTRLALLDHVTSPTGLVWPMDRLVDALGARGIDVLVDGAHAPGMVPVDLQALGAAYYTGNCHKWLCAPKGAGFLHVRPDRQAGVRPTTISHGANIARTDRSRFRLEFDWTGTIDPSAYLCVPEAIQFLGGLLSGGWPDLMRRNRALALEARCRVGAALGIPLPCPDEMIGALAAVPITDSDSTTSTSPFDTDPLQDRLLERHRIEIPVIPWPAAPKRLVRLSAQIYNQPRDYERLAEALRDLLEAHGRMGDANRRRAGR